VFSLGKKGGGQTGRDGKNQHDRKGERKKTSNKMLWGEGGVGKKVMRGKKKTKSSRKTTKGRENFGRKKPKPGPVNGPP